MNLGSAIAKASAGNQHSLSAILPLGLRVWAFCLRVSVKSWLDCKKKQFRQGQVSKFLNVSKTTRVSNKKKLLRFADFLFWAKHLFFFADGYAP